MKQAEATESSRIEIERQDDGEYAAWRVTRQGNSETFDQIRTEHISKPIPYGESVSNWANNLSDDELEAAILIFTDRWTWDSGKEEDRICLEALEEERNWRQVPQHDHSMPSHSHVMSIPNTGAKPAHPIRGDLWVDPVTFQHEIFDGQKWCVAKLTTQNSMTSVAGGPAHSHCHSVSPQYAIATYPPKSTP